jgi:hypothetical protein
LNDLPCHWNQSAAPVPPSARILSSAAVACAPGLPAPLQPAAPVRPDPVRPRRLRPTRPPLGCGSPALGRGTPAMRSGASRSGGARHAPRREQRKGAA